MKPNGGQQKLVEVLTCDLGFNNACIWCYSATHIIDCYKISSSQVALVITQWIEKVDS